MVFGYLHGPSSLSFPMHMSNYYLMNVYNCNLDSTTEVKGIIVYLHYRNEYCDWSRMLTVMCIGNSPSKSLIKMECFIIPLAHYVYVFQSFIITLLGHYTYIIKSSTLHCWDTHLLKLLFQVEKCTWGPGVWGKKKIMQIQTSGGGIHWLRNVSITVTVKVCPLIDKGLWIYQ